MDDREPNGERVLYLKYWHIVLMLIVQLIGLGVCYGKLSQGIDDLTRRVSVMESNKFVGRDEYNDFKSDLRDRLDRIETEILERNKTERELR